MACPVLPTPWGLGSLRVEPNSGSASCPWRERHIPAHARGLPAGLGTAYAPTSTPAPTSPPLQLRPFGQLQGGAAGRLLDALRQGPTVGRSGPPGSLARGAGSAPSLGATTCPHTGAVTSPLSAPLLSPSPHFLHGEQQTGCEGFGQNTGAGSGSRPCCQGAGPHVRGRRRPGPGLESAGGPRGGALAGRSERRQLCGC